MNELLSLHGSFLFGFCAGSQSMSVVSRALERLKAYYLALDAEDLESELEDEGVWHVSVPKTEETFSNPVQCDQPSDSASNIISTSDVASAVQERESCASTSPDVADDDDASSCVAELPPQGNLRWATHDGVVGRSSPEAQSLGRERPDAPQSEPPARARGRVRWACDVTSPKQTREALHKRARELTQRSLSAEAAAAASGKSSWLLGSSSSSSIQDAPHGKRQRKNPSRFDE